MKTTKNQYVKVASLGQIAMGQRKLVEVDDVVVALFNLDGEIYAIEDMCTHDGGPLAEGDIVNGCELECPRHGARFDIRSGAALSFPAFRPTTIYAVKMDGDDILIELPA